MKDGIALDIVKTIQRIIHKISPCCMMWPKKELNVIFGCPM